MAKASQHAVTCLLWLVALTEQVWTHWLTYVMFAGAFLFAGTNVVFMVKGLLEFEALFMVTLFEGSMIVSNCISASVVLLELKGLEPCRVMGYAGSVGLVVSGMVHICVSEAGSAKKKAEENPIDKDGKQVATVCGAADDEGEAASGEDFRC